MYKIKIWSDVNKDWSRALHNNNKYIKQFAPDNIEFVESVDNADYKIVHIIGENELNLCYPFEKTIPFFYCFLTGSLYPTMFWRDVVKNVPLVLSYYPLNEWFEEKFNFYRTPLGVDVNIFKRDYRRQKENAVLSTGYVSETERIEAFYKAFSMLGYKVFHVGKDFSFGKNFVYFENVNTEVIVDLYNRSKYVNAIRVVEGYEIGAIEGGLCGARPICLNNNIYSYWYEDFPIYIKDDGFMTDDEVAEAIIIAVLNDKRKEVTEGEMDWLRNRFNIERVYTDLWRNILSYL